MSVLISGLSARATDKAGMQTEILSIDLLEFGQGKLTAISGPSGSGKSTLLNVIAGISPIFSGSVEVDGLVVSAMTEGARDRWRRLGVGLVFQDFNLIGGLSPLENILLPASFGRTAANCNGRARSLMEQLGIPRRRGQTATMSRGEQQRVALARALLFDPPLLLADEPTASLDQANGQFAINMLRDAAKEGKTVICASHDPALLAAADRIIRLDHGKLQTEAGQ